MEDKNNNPIEEKVVEVVETVNDEQTEKQPVQKKNFSRDGKKFDRPRRNPREKEKLYDEEVIEIKKVVKVNKGGRQLRFSAVVVVGDRKGKVGIGTGKSNEVPEAIKKAIQSATKNVVKVPLVDNRTISHEIVGKVGATRVILKPAKPGNGVIAGGAVRAVLELAGVKDIISKALGARTKLNMANATLKGLTSTKSAEHVAELRGKTVEELLG